MSDYKHGDWYCKPANEEEAKEIIERAIASGAVNKDAWRGNSMRRDYGVSNGNVVYGFSLGTEYTIEELRHKFPLPGEQVEEPKQWRGPEDWLPPVGWHGECNWLKNKEWFECVALPGGKVAHKHRHSESWAIGDYGLLEFRPLRTERDRWVEAAANGLSGDMSMLKHSEFILCQIYDAMQSGQLKAPTNEPG